MQAKHLALVAVALLIAYVYIRRGSASGTGAVYGTYNSAGSDGGAPPALPGGYTGTDQGGAPVKYTTGPTVEAQSGIGHFVTGGNAPPGLDDVSTTLTSATTTGPTVEARSGRGHF